MANLRLFSQGLGWNQDGEILLDGNSRPALIKGENLIHNLLMFHLFTSPGEYKIAPQVGFGILDIAGKANNQSNRSKLELSINSYFQNTTEFDPYILRAKVTSVNDSTIDLTITVAGPDLDDKSTLIINITQGGRRVKVVNFLGDDIEEDSIATSTTVSGESENPYLSRLIAADS